MPSECTAVKTSDERKQILAKKKLCFNCAGARHQASKCQSKRGCAICGRRQAIQYQFKKPADTMMLFLETGSIFSDAVAMVDGVKL